MTDQPPGRLGCEESGHGNGQGPDPLNGIGNTVGPFIADINEALENAGREQLSNHPAEIDVGGEVWPKRDRCHLGGVGGGERLENTPRETRKNVSCEEHVNVDGEESDEDGAGDEQKSPNHGQAVTNSFRNDTVQEKTDDLSSGGSVAESCLPGGADFVGLD